MSACAACRHFAELPNECRAKAPQPVMVQGAMGQPVVLGVFPATKPDNWCGEWQPSSTPS